jgi:hypothetical protein
MALIGSEGAGMFLHQDVLRTGSWQVQLHGSKLWFLCAPNQSSFLYGGLYFIVYLQITVIVCNWWILYRWCERCRRLSSRLWQVPQL